MNNFTQVMDAIGERIDSANKSGAYARFEQSTLDGIKIAAQNAYPAATVTVIEYDDYVEAYPNAFNDCTYDGLTFEDDTHKCAVTLRGLKGTGVFNMVGATKIEEKE